MGGRREIFRVVPQGWEALRGGPPQASWETPRGGPQASRPVAPPSSPRGRGEARGSNPWAVNVLSMPFPGIRLVITCECSRQGCEDSTSRCSKGGVPERRPRLGVWSAARPPPLGPPRPPAALRPFALRAPGLAARGPKGEGPKGRGGGSQDGPLRGGLVTSVWPRYERERRPPRPGVLLRGLMPHFPSFPHAHP